MKRLTVLFLAALVIGTTAARAETNPPSAPPAALTSAAERLYAAARPKLLQIRTLLAAAGQQSSIGSGFLVSANGLAITNYHVVSQFALEPATYRLEYMAADGSRGDVALLAIDVPNDLAVVRVDKRDAPFFQFDARALTEGVPKGEHLYSMGNPLDLGFTIVEGTYNGLVERSYNERIHFTGAVNPGMSGGPAVAGDGRVVGINVATVRRRARQFPGARPLRRHLAEARARGRRPALARKNPRRDRPPSRRLGRRPLQIGRRAGFPSGSARALPGA
jgi:serine protease Do